MGCLKLTYREEESPLKVVHNNLTTSEKSCAGDYRYGFNGAEKIDEIKGSGNHYDLGLRNFDPRLARMFSIDPMASDYSWQTPYAYHRNMPVSTVDFLGGGDDPGEGEETAKVNEPVEVNDVQNTNSTVTPLTSKGLRSLARKNGFTGTGINFSRKVGKKFEELALLDKLFVPNYRRFTSKARTLATGGKVKSVVPDGTRKVKKVEYKFPATLETTLMDGSWLEVKAYKSPLRQSTSRYQMKGLIDAVSKTRAGKEGRASLSIVTTSDTKISSDLIAYATSKKVHLYHSVAGQTSDGKIVFSDWKPLNIRNIDLTQVWNWITPQGGGYSFTPGNILPDKDTVDPEVVPE